MKTIRTLEKRLRIYGGAVAIVTGGGSGIGAALGRGLVARGAHVVLADRDVEGARNEAESLRAGGAPVAAVEAVEVDVRDPEAVKRLVATTFETHHRLDYLFNNAGIGIGGEARTLTLGDWSDSFAVNLMGPVHGVLAAYPRMVEQGYGHIVSTASMAAFLATPLAAPYGAAKSAVLGLSRALRVEAAEKGVRVSVLCPGVVRTPILRDGGRYGRTPLTVLDPAEQDALWGRLRPMNADVFAVKALRAIARNRGTIVIPAWWHALRLLNAVSPSAGEALARRELRRVRPRLRRAPLPPRKGRGGTH